MKPIQAGAAYSNFCKTMVLKTSFNEASSNPCAFKVRKAKRDLLHCSKTFRTCSEKLNCESTMTPRTGMDWTRLTPGVEGGIGTPLRDKKTSSAILFGLSLRLQDEAQRV